MRNKILEAEANRILRTGRVVRSETKIKEAISEPEKPKTKRKPRPRISPRKRSWAHRYLRYVAEEFHFPYDSARDSMEGLARYLGLEMPASIGTATRSRPAIELAHLIQAKTGIVMTERQESDIAHRMAVRRPAGGF